VQSELYGYLLTYLLHGAESFLRSYGLQLVKKFPAFHGTRRFITALTSVRHLSLSWASPIQTIYTHPTSWRSVLILSTHLRLGLPSGFFPFPSGFPQKDPIHPPHRTHTRHMPSIRLHRSCIFDFIQYYYVWAGIAQSV